MSDLITREDERRALRLVLGMVDSDDAACRAVIAEAVDASRHSHLLVATARYAADLTAQAVPDAGSQLRDVLLGMAADEGGAR